MSNAKWIPVSNRPIAVLKSYWAPRSHQYPTCSGQDCDLHFESDTEIKSKTPPQASGKPCFCPRLNGAPWQQDIVGIFSECVKSETSFLRDMFDKSVNVMRTHGWCYSAHVIDGVNSSISNNGGKATNKPDREDEVRAERVRSVKIVRAVSVEWVDNERRTDERLVHVQCNRDTYWEHKQTLRGSRGWDVSIPE